MDLCNVPVAKMDSFECVTACKHCSGTSCENAPAVALETELTSDAEDDSLIDCTNDLPTEEFGDTLDSLIPWLNEEIVDDN